MLVEGRLSGKRNSRVIWSRCQTEDFACGCWAWMALVKVKGCKAVGRLERRRSAKRSSGRRRGGGGGDGSPWLPSAPKGLDKAKKFRWIEVRCLTGAVRALLGELERPGGRASGEAGGGGSNSEGRLFFPQDAVNTPCLEPRRLGPAPGGGAEQSAWRRRPAQPSSAERFLQESPPSALFPRSAGSARCQQCGDPHRARKSAPQASMIFRS